MGSIQSHLSGFDLRIVKEHKEIEMKYQKGMVNSMIVLLPGVFVRPTWRWQRTTHPFHASSR
jgi:hypothetical protein